MNESLLVKQAKALIASVKGKALSIEERKDRSIALAALLLEEAERIETPKEKKQQAYLAAMLNDPSGKAFTTLITDQCFRSRRPKRVANQLAFVIKTLGIPSFLPLLKKLALRAMADFGELLAPLFVPLTIEMIRSETRTVIMPGEKKALSKHLQRRKAEGVRINLNHLGEAILGEEEAERRLEVYLNDLSDSSIEYISIKISTLYSQINLLAWEKTLEILSDRLRKLYRAAMQHPYKLPDGSFAPKFVNLDMEEYRDLHLTVALFRRVLDEAEFYRYAAGIALQSYLPDSFLIQQELTVWAMQRISRGGSPIKIRIVKGANLAMEQVESALRLWPQAPYCTKEETDANFKRMLAYGSQKNHAQAARLGVGSHNLFDIAYALLLRSEFGTEDEICFEMLEGMADHMRRAVQQVSGGMLLYCPAATTEEFQYALAYLVRRLDENTAPENFLRHAFHLKAQSPDWDRQAQLFSDACQRSEDISNFPQRSQNRLSENLPLCQNLCCAQFLNEPDTDWSLPQNRKWAEIFLQEWRSKTHPLIPLVIGGQEAASGEKTEEGVDPSFPGMPLYRYVFAGKNQALSAIEAAKTAEGAWSKTPITVRAKLLQNVADEMRKHRSDLIGAMVADTGKTVFEADTEVSEAIDFAQYYSFNIQEWQDLSDIEWKPKGTVLVAPPWNFPCSIPAGGILAALASGNCVIFKPAPESVLVGWELAKLFWQGGISKHVLQFIPCEDDPVGTLMVKDPRISAIVLTGATATAKLFLSMRPGLDLMAETGGKNAMVVTAMSDRDLCIKDLVQSAFGHAGQKCSACSLAILEAEVYDDPQFLRQLADAAKSLPIGSPWSLETKINPLIRPPGSCLMRGLTELESGESWLLEPKSDPGNPNLWSPGIKLGVTPSSFTFQTELFGPVLGLVRADSFEHALDLMNQTPYGLTAGIHTLDVREQQAWLARIVAGNCYINRTMTGAIAERQPFGGCKESGFGKGAKAGGPNYLVQFMEARQISLPGELAPLNSEVKTLSDAVEKDPAFAEKLVLDIWKASVGSYAYFWNEYFSKSHDPSCVLGQDNLQCYAPHAHIVLRWQKDDSSFDILRSVAAALTSGAKMEISTETEAQMKELKAFVSSDLLTIQQEDNSFFIAKVKAGGIKRLRLLSRLSPDVEIALAEAACNINYGAVLANGRLELLQYLREISVSCDYHRYGNLGLRENERRHPLPSGQEKDNHLNCQECTCP